MRENRHYIQSGETVDELWLVKNLTIIIEYIKKFSIVEPYVVLMK